MSLFRRKKITPEGIAADREKAGLARTLGTFDLIALGIGAIIGTGIFVLTGVAAARYAGPGVTLSFIISGLAATFAALVYAEFASMVPAAGSAYTYAYASLGEIVAWLIGWNLILEYLVAAGAVAIGWGSYFTDLLRSLGITLPQALTRSVVEGGILNLPALFITLFITILAIRGTRESAWVNRIVVAMKIGVILLFLVLALTKVNPANWRPFLPFGFAGAMRGAAIIFFAYIGFDAVATAAEEVKNPQRTLPRGIIGSLFISTILYILVALALTGVLPYPRLNTPSPVSAALLATGFRFASAVVAVGALAGLTSVLLVNTYAQSRIFYAMARDGLLPKTFAVLHPRYRTPYLNNLIIGGIIALLSSLLPIRTIAELANIGTLSAFVVVSAGVLILRRTTPDLPRPFRTPLMPWTPLLAIAFSLYLILYLPRLTLIRFVFWVALGLVVYFVYSRRHSLLAEPLPAKKAVPASYLAFLGRLTQKKKRP